jgi:NAD(P)H dehydrogenase (quinone)
VLTGPEALSFADVAERVSEVFARQVDYENQMACRARKAMLDSGLDRWVAEGRQRRIGCECD